MNIVERLGFGTLGIIIKSGGGSNKIDFCSFDSVGEWKEVKGFWKEKALFAFDCLRRVN